MNPAVINGSYKYPDRRVSLQIITLEFEFFFDFNRYATAFAIYKDVSALSGSWLTKHLIPSVPKILPINPFIKYIN